MCKFTRFDLKEFKKLFWNFKIEYSNEGHLLAIAYENILQFSHHNDYDQITYATVNDKKVKWFSFLKYLFLI